MFRDHFSHLLSYGVADHQTMRGVSGHFDALLVPGTVAAFQREGTSGFLLTLSATQQRTPYCIDPRFPLFQQPLPQPKKSHVLLADLLGDSDLVSSQGPTPDDFPPERIEGIAAAWVKFNLGYREASPSKKFEKYAKLLGERVDSGDAQGPELVLAPYCVTSTGPEDAWWAVSCALYQATARLTAGQIPCVRVIAAEEPWILGQLLRAVPDERVAVWVSGLNELEADAGTLHAYREALSIGLEKNQQLVGLYGGFFSVLCAGSGLSGVSHGIGYGEFRQWLELPQSGPPPARYYVPRLHRFVSQEFAYQLWSALPELASCNCSICRQRNPWALEYHELMMHSVVCRQMEIAEWASLSAEAARTRLRGELKAFQADITRARLKEVAEAQARRLASTLGTWEQALA